VAIFIKRLPGRSLQDVKCIVATHFHIDHMVNRSFIEKMFARYRCFISFPCGSLFKKAENHCHFGKKFELPYPVLKLLTGFLSAAVFSTRYARSVRISGLKVLRGFPSSG